MKAVMGMVMMIFALAGCATSSVADRTLSAPPGTQPAAVTAMKEGNRLFAARQWEGAKAQYEAAISAQPTLAEAHYNLALVYDVLRDDVTARLHYMEAANLAPGNKVIWDAPPLRRHGDVDAHPKQSDTMFMPAVGGSR